MPMVSETYWELLLFFNTSSTIYLQRICTHFFFEPLSCWSCWLDETSCVLNCDASKCKMRTLQLLKIICGLTLGSFYKLQIFHYVCYLWFLMPVMFQRRLVHQSRTSIYFTSGVCDHWESLNITLFLGEHTNDLRPVLCSVSRTVWEGEITCTFSIDKWKAKASARIDCHTQPGPRLRSISSCFFSPLIPRKTCDKWIWWQKKSCAELCARCAAVKVKYDLFRKAEWRSKRSARLEISGAPLKRDTWSITGWFDLERQDGEW